MASEDQNNNLLLGWSDHAENFQISLASLLQRKEFVDVTLIADGYSFTAHRLVLSALSPYLCQVFAQMPTNQPAIGIGNVCMAHQLQINIWNFLF